MYPQTQTHTHTADEKKVLKTAVIIKHWNINDVEWVWWWRRQTKVQPSVRTLSILYAHTLCSLYHFKWMCRLFYTKNARDTHTYACTRCKKNSTEPKRSPSTIWVIKILLFLTCQSIVQWWWWWHAFRPHWYCRWH